jgi:thiamine-monophosphate kinase
MLVGVGDDAAVVEPERNRVEVLTVDAMVEGVHFDRAFTPPGAIGHRALAANLSDLAAMGAAPRLALLSFVVPADLPLADYDGIVGGILTLAARHGVHVAGGNLTRSPGPLVIDITVTGTVKRRQALTRSGARAGDEIYVSGTIGAAAAGLQMLQAARSLSTTAGASLSITKDTEDTEDTEDRRTTRRDDPRESDNHTAEQDFSPVSSLASVAESHDAASACIHRYLFPEPRVRLGMLLARNRAASACMDLSDGLADAVRQVAAASGVGATLDAAALPIEAAARAWFTAHGEDPVAASLASGDDYELMVCVRPRARRRLEALTGRGGVPLTRVGVFTAQRALVVDRPSGAMALPDGYAHFGRG